MVVILTYRAFLLYALDIMSKDECAASTFFIACNQVRYDVGAYSSGSQTIDSRSLWPDVSEIDTCLAKEHAYRDKLDNISTSASDTLGKLMLSTLTLPTFMFVQDIPRNTALVHTLQQWMKDVYGIGSIWFDGAIYDNDPNEIAQDDAKVKERYKEHTRQARKTIRQARTPSGAIYRDTRMMYLNSMSEADMRKYLKKEHNVDTAGMDGTAVYSMMVDLFVDESAGPGQSGLRSAIQDRYRRRKKKKRK